MILLLGFPTLHSALISNLGLIKDFTIDGIKNENFPILPKKAEQVITNCDGYFCYQIIEKSTLKKRVLRWQMGVAKHFG